MSRRALRDLVVILGIVGLLASATLLPPDTSLRVVKDRGSLRVCVPEEYPPLVTEAGSERPGLDVELVESIAERMSVQLHLVPNPSIGRDFNPRNWRVNRAQCEVLAGGVVVSERTRSFMETSPPYLATGWAIVFTDRDLDLARAEVGFVPGSTGLDRISLSTYLRSIGASVRRYPDLRTLERAILDGEVEAGMGEALSLRVLAGRTDMHVAYLPLPSARVPIALGLWKGDLTLLRAVRRAVRRLESEGYIDALADSYDLAPIEATCSVCP